MEDAVKNCRLNTRVTSEPKEHYSTQASKDESWIRVVKIKTITSRKVRKSSDELPEFHVVGG